MLIDWFTVIAQAINFLVLVWLMKRFLYQPILDAIDAREERIAKALASADAQQAEANKEREEYRSKNEEFAGERAALLSQAKAEAQSEHQRLLDAARQDAAAFREKRQETLRSDARNLNRALRERTQQEVFAIARKTLSDLSGRRLEEALCEVFLRRLRTLDDGTKSIFAAALQGAADPACLRSVFDLPAQEKASIQSALNETFKAEIPLRFESGANLISGIELAIDGHKLAWNIADYLTMMEQGIGEVLKGKDGADASTPPGSLLEERRENEKA